MDSHYSADVATEIPPTGGKSEVFRGIESISVDHEVTSVFVSGIRLAPVSTIEPLWQVLLLNFVDAVHVKPLTVAG
jgi:hypothetical protein